MPRVLNIVNNLKLELAKSNRDCSKCHGSIAPGEEHLAAYEGIKRKNYCQACAPELLARARQHLDEIESNL